MSIDDGALRQIIGYEQEMAASRDRDVLASVAALRRDLDQIERAVERGERVPSGVTSDPFVSSTARDLVRAIYDRKATYDLIVRLDQIAVGDA